MGALIEVLETLLDFVGWWRFCIAVSGALLLGWLVLEFGPAGLAGQVIAGVLVLAGIVVGLRWERSTQ